MKLSLILLPILLLFNTTSAQRTIVENNILLLPQMIPLNQLSGYGYTSLTGTSSNINSLNPAALSSVDRISAGVLYQYQSNLEEAWIADIGSKWISNAAPQSVGLVYPAGDFRIAAGMTQFYRATLDIGRIPATTIYQPDGTGEFITVNYKTKINQYSLSGSYLIKNAFKTSSSLSLGFRINYNDIHEHQGIGLIQIDERFGAIDFAAGVVYDIRNTKIGLSYESGFEKRISYQMSGSGISLPIIDSIRVFKIVQNHTLVCTTPAKLNAGILAELKNNFVVSGNLNYIWWNSITENSHSEWQISGSLIYKASGFFSGSAGLLYIREQYSKQLDESFNINDKMSALYFTIGAQVNFYNFYADLSLADSYFTGGDWRKHTIGKFGVGYNF